MRNYTSNGILKLLKDNLSQKEDCSHRCTVRYFNNLTKWSKDYREDRGQRIRSILK